MHPTQFGKHIENLPGFDERMVMIRQHTPRVDQSGSRFKDVEPCSAKFLHSLIIVSDVVPMLKTRSRNMVTVFFARAMRWPVPGKTLFLAPAHQAFALGGR